MQAFCASAANCGEAVDTGEPFGRQAPASSSAKASSSGVVDASKVAAASLPPVASSSLPQPADKPAYTTAPSNAAPMPTTVRARIRRTIEATSASGNERTIDRRIAQGNAGPVVACLCVTRATHLAVAAFALGVAAGCSSTSTIDEDANNGIYGAWDGRTATSATGVRLQLTSDGSYTLTELIATSATTANARAERGTFTAAPGTITWTPVESSCNAASSSYQSAYQLTGATLSVALPAGVFALEPADDDGGLGDASLTLGCYASDGAFTAAPLAPVSPLDAGG